MPFLQIKTRIQREMRKDEIMPGLNFNKRFTEDVRAGEKLQTIRKRRTPPIKEGSHLTLWTGMRTKNCEPLGDATCTNVSPIKIIIEKGEIWLWDEETEYQDSDGEIIGNFYLLKPEETEAFARADGFSYLTEFFDFFRHYPPDVLCFDLVLIQWSLGWDFKRERAK
jgi:hypothetical protein